MPEATPAKEPQTTSGEPPWAPPSLHLKQAEVTLSQARNRLVMAGRRGGKTLLEEWEAFDYGQLQGHPVGWFAPTYKILLDAWEDIQRRFGPFIRDKRESEHRLWWRSGAVLEFWSLDSGVVARSRKYKLAVIDEAGLVPQLEQRWRADIEPTLMDLDGRGLFGSTPNLVSPDFVTFFNRGTPPSREWASFRWSTLDNPYLPANVGERIKELERQGVPSWIIAQEYHAIPAESDRSFFRKSDLELHRRDHVRPPSRRGKLDVRPEVYGQRFDIIKRGDRPRLAWVDDPSGATKLWCDPEPPPEVYCIGCDLGYGVGSSNTVFSIGRRSDRRKIAEYAWPGVAPEEAAVLCAALGWWFRSPSGPAWVCFEANGPGEMFAKTMHDLEYPALWFERASPTDAGWAATTKKYGWRSSAESKKFLLDNFRAAMVNGRFVEPCAEALDECPSYQYDDQMRVTSLFERTKSRDDPARVKHGDRVIASALLNLCFDWTPAMPAPKQPAYPRGSYGELMGLEDLIPSGTSDKPRWVG